VSKLLGAAGVVAVLVLAMTFAALNGDQRVTLDLGWVTLYRVPVTLVAFGGLFFGMLVMLLAGLNSDLRVRRILRQRLVEEDRNEKGRVDVNQRDLFTGDEEEPERRVDAD
jgi:uncharacterized integral membrane protein